MKICFVAEIGSRGICSAVKRPFVCSWCMPNVQLLPNPVSAMVATFFKRCSPQWASTSARSASE